MHGTAPPPLRSGAGEDTVPASAAAVAAAAAAAAAVVASATRCYEHRIYGISLTKQGATRVTSESSIREKHRFTCCQAAPAEGACASSACSS
eukprot:4191950-Pyramimonas_sp.AAC.1